MATCTVCNKTRKACMLRTPTNELKSSNLFSSHELCNINKNITKGNKPNTRQNTSAVTRAEAASYS